MSFNSGDVVIVDFPDVKGIKRRPAVILSSVKYHSIRYNLFINIVKQKVLLAQS